MFRRVALFPLVLACSLPLQAAAQVHWVASWSASPTARPEKTPDAPEQTLRELVHISLGGTQLRFTFSNQFGTDPLLIGGASIAQSLSGSAIDPSTLHAITFAGKTYISIAPGATVQSDPVAMPTKPLTDLAVTLFLPAQHISQTTIHQVSQQTNYRVLGNHLTDPDLANAAKQNPYQFLTALDVLAPSKSAAIVALGDSITDGNRSTPNANHRWPNFLADRLQAYPRYAHLAVVDAGISGNRVLNDGTGPSALSRFDADVLAQSGVKYLIILEGINDVARFFHTNQPADKVTAAQIIAGLTQLIARAHAHGIRVYGCTLLPLKSNDNNPPEAEALRDAVNNFIRTAGKFDAVIDFDRVVADPAHPLAMRPEYDSGDHDHPGDLGYKAMADSIDLSLFTK